MFDFMMVSLFKNSCPAPHRSESLSNLHDSAAAGLANAAALARFAARVLNWLWLDDGRDAGGGGRHVAVRY